MENNISRQLSNRLKKQRLKKRWYKIVSVAAAIVVFCTTYALILPAITMGNQFVCGFEEHTHTDECYEVQNTYPSAEIICTDKLNIHKHTDACYDKDKNLICYMADFVLHTHDFHCFNRDGELICTLDEVKAHTHTEDCYDNDGKLVCKEQEIILHTHTDECYDKDKNLVCTQLQAIEHQHSELCVDRGEPTEIKTLVCDKQEHTHTDECKIPKDKTLTYSDSDMEVTLKLPGDTNLPNDAELVVTPITQDADSYNSVLSAIDEQVADKTVSDIGIYDMDIVSDGETVDLPNQLTALVDAKFKNPILSSDDISASQLKTFSIVTDDDNSDSGEEDENLVAVEVDEDYKLKSGGVNEVSFTANAVSPFAVMLAASPTDASSYWQRVSEIDDTDANYMIVSTGTNNYAFGIARSGISYSASSTRITLTQVSGYDGYYTAVQTSGNSDITDAMKWNFTETGTSSRQRNVSYSNYYLRLNSTTIVSTTNTTNTLTYTSSNKYWRISYRGNTSTYYLSGGTSFSRSTQTTNANLMIFKEVSSLPGGAGGTGTISKPDYDDFIETSDYITGERDDNGLTVTHASDAATSQIESFFREDDYNKAKAYDGKIITDKSVVYMSDDYGAFDSYDEDTFGITLSALGQQFAISEEYGAKVPLDIVFVLDASGSMVTYNAGDNVTRAEAMVTAVNTAMADIYALNPENRVGVVCFSGGGAKLLDLGKYSAPNNKFLTMTGYSSRTETIRPNTALTSLDGHTYRGSFNQWYGTYTQYGIALGAQMLIDETETIYDGEIFIPNEQTGEVIVTPYSVTRQPIIILLSDGEPTYATDSYDNVLSSGNRMYGDGVSGTDNSKGVLGYYTILSANYYKEQITQHYNLQSAFYSVGMGINATGTGASVPDSPHGDHYKRAVLNPSPSNIAALNTTAGTNAANTNQQLYSLLNNTYSGSTVTVSQATDNSYGIPKSRTYSNIPVIPNPYKTSGYSYADSSLIDNDITTQDLVDTFNQFIELSSNLDVYSFILRSGTDVTLIDRIGEGMEIKAPPVLRYQGQDFTVDSTSVNGNVTTYSYTGTYTSFYTAVVARMEKIIVTVTDEADGTQTVRMDVPYTELPVYSPNTRNHFYYEALPVRLIYKVGLTDEATQAVENLRNTGGILTYYTNKWDATDQSVLAQANFQPTDDNPYFSTEYLNDTLSREKSYNVTETVENYFSFVPSTESEDYEHYYLGNNGLLQFSYPLPPSVDIPVQKVWGEDTPASLKTAVTVRLYRSADGGVNVSEVSEVEPLVLSSANDWTDSWTDLDITDDFDNIYTYYVAEDKVGGFYTSYSSDIERIWINSTPITAATVSINSENEADTVVITNTKGVTTLPSTGGAGTRWYTITGLLLMLTATCLYINKKTLKKRKNSS